MSENKTPRTEAAKFKLTWRNGAYYVSRHGIDSMFIVPAEDSEKLEQELQSAQAAVQFHSEQCDKTQEENEKFALRIKQLDEENFQFHEEAKLAQAENGRMREALKHIDAEIMRSGNFYEEGDSGSAIAILASLEGYGAKALATQLAGEMFVPWSLLKEYMEVKENHDNWTMWNDRATQPSPYIGKYTYLLKQLQSYAPTSEVKGCKYCLKDECECSDADASPDMGDK